jgi:GxxExxY protein
MVRSDLNRTDGITGKIIGFAIDLHRDLGPGLLESAYEECLCFEPENAGLAHRHDVSLPVVYKSGRVDCGYRIDIVVENRVIVETNAIERSLPVHEAQLLTELKQGGIGTGLLLNFNAPVPKGGLLRRVL